MFEIGTVGLTATDQGVAVVNAKLHNVPANLTKDWPLRTPGNGRPEMWFFKIRALRHDREAGISVVPVSLSLWEPAYAAFHRQAPVAAAAADALVHGRRVRPGPGAPRRFPHQLCGHAGLFGFVHGRGPGRGAPAAVRPGPAGLRPVLPLAGRVWSRATWACRSNTSGPIRN